MKSANKFSRSSISMAPVGFAFLLITLALYAFAPPAYGQENVTPHAQTEPSDIRTETENDSLTSSNLRLIPGEMPASSAQPDFCVDFESGSLPDFMSAEITTNSGATGRVEVLSRYPATGAYGVEVDTICPANCGPFTRQAVIMSVDLAGLTDVELDFWLREFDDENHAEDGVFISDDGGANYQRIYSFNDHPNAFSQITLDLDVETTNVGMNFVDGFLIKFQGYDNYNIASDGYSLDDICVFKIADPPDSVDIELVNGDDIQLQWNDTGAGSYEVWFTANEPYFSPGADCNNPAPYKCEISETTTWYGDNLAGHPDLNYSFVVTIHTLQMQAAQVQNTNRTEAFNFALSEDFPANLSLTTTTDDPIILSSATTPIIYTLHYTNTSSYDAHHVVITETLPAHTQFEAGLSSAGWVQDPTDETIYTLDVGALAPAASGQADFAVTIDGWLPASLANTATIQDTQGIAPDPDVSDNTANVTSTLTCTPDSDGDRLPDWAETNTGVYINPLDTGTNPNSSDTDNDAIDDGDEALGTEDGLDLPGMGANPLRQNILLEYDWFEDDLDCGHHSHRPTAAAMDMLTTAFANAPILNPDGSTGVTVINDYGQGGLFSGGNFIDDANGVIDWGVSGAEFRNYRAANFAPNRQGYFHYVLLPHQYNTDSRSSGQAEYPGDDLIVSLQCYTYDNYIAHTVMHELGHNLYLHHGGDEACNRKPNYNSVMNYKYQFPGVDNNCTPPGDSVLSYSSGDRISLDEHQLNEFDGTCGTVEWDWNENSEIEDPVNYNVNSYSYETEECGGTHTVHHDFNDWANLYFHGLAGTMSAQSVTPEIITEDPLPPWVIDQGPAH